MSEIDSQIEQVEVSLEQAKAIIKKGDALDRLTRNKDFEEVILQGYFKDEAARLVQMRSEPNLSDPADREHVLRMIDAIGSLQVYLRQLGQHADMARRAMVDDEQTLEDLQREALDS